MDDAARHNWIASRILPHEGEVRLWLRRNISALTLPDIDDLMQEAYARIWSTDFSHVQNARSYFHTVIHNLLIERARRARIVRMELMSEIEMLRLPCADPEPERRISARQQLEQLWQIVMKLPTQWQRTFKLRYLDGLSHQEIAQAMGISRKTVEKHQAKALARIADALAAELSNSFVADTVPGNLGHDSEHNNDC